MLATTVNTAPPQAAQLIDNLDAFGTLPEVTTRIMAVVNDPRSTASQLHRIIAHDPSLVTKILKLVNSAFYGQTHKIDSVERAIVMLGFDNIHHLAVAASLGQLFRGKICEGYSAKDLWTHSIAVGVTAREMAKLINRPIAEEVFLAGIVHDVGLLATLQLMPEKLKQVCEIARQDSTPFHILEQDIIGVDHQDLGSALADKWKFPPACRMAAGSHHHPAQAQEDLQLITALVHVADTLCCQDKIGFSLTAQHQSMDEAEFGGLVPLPIIHSTAENLQGLVWTAIRIFG